MEGSYTSLSQASGDISSDMSEKAPPEPNGTAEQNETAEQNGTANGTADMPMEPADILLESTSRASVAYSQKEKPNWKGAVIKDQSLWVRWKFGSSPNAPELRYSLYFL